MDSARLLVAIWKEGSLTGAARRLELSVATVSRRLAALESELGLVLFERSTRRLRVTEPGRALAVGLERGLEEIDSALRRARDLEKVVAGVVRMTVPPSLAPVFAPMLTAFIEAYPKVRLHVYSTERRLAFVHEDVDVMIRVGRLEEQSLVAREIARYPHVLCARPESAAAVKTPADLVRRPLFLFGHLQSAYSLRLSRDAEHVDLEPGAVTVANDYALLMQMLSTSDGVAELPGILAAGPISEGRLARVLPQWRLPETSLSMLYPRRRLPRAVRALVDHLAAAFAALPRGPL